MANIATTLEQLRMTAARAKTAADIATYKVDALHIPAKVSELTNDANFQTAAQVSTAIQSAVAASGHASFRAAASVPTVAQAEEGILYLVMNAQTGHYDIYALVQGAVVLLDDTTVDLSGYVEKETGKGLSSNDFTDEEKAKLANLQFATDEEVTSMLDDVFGAS